jgi:hypothetical protein
MNPTPKKIKQLGCIGKVSASEAGDIVDLRFLLCSCRPVRRPVGI